MARRRGFFAELQHQAAVAERDRRRVQVVAVRDADRRHREAERASVDAERARVAAGRADSRAQAAAEREAKRLHAEARQAEVEALNADLASVLADIDDVLNWTLDIDDFVDLQQLRQVAQHPPFTSRHQTPVPPPAPVFAHPEPTYVDPPAPTGIGSLFKKKEHAAVVERQRMAFAEGHAKWQAEVAAIPGQQRRRHEQHQAAETDRLMKLKADNAAYEAQCRQRSELIAADNEELADLIKRYSAGEADAVEEYCGIVFGNSIYPDAVPLGIGIEYKRSDRELEIALSLPKPEDLPTTKTYKYVKAKDEIAQTLQTAKEQRDRYTSLVQHIVLRTVHEMWEADRARHIDTIALTAGVEHISRATGRSTTTPLVALACDRHAFEHLNLAQVTPSETLTYLNAVVSKNPHGLVPIAGSGGVRG